MVTTRFRKPAPSEQAVLNRVEVTLLGADPAQRARFDTLIETEHYLKNSRLVGEQLRYVAHVEGEWVALLSWSARSLSPPCKNPPCFRPLHRAAALRRH